MTALAIVADIEHETDLEVERLLAEADARAAAILAAARVEVRQAVEAAEARATPQARLDAARQVNAARLRLIERRAERATALAEAVFAEADRRLRELADATDDAAAGRWARALIGLLDEALAVVGPGGGVTVRRVDLPLVEGRVAAGGAVVASAETAAPGIHATSADGRIEIDATLPARLERARVRLAGAVATRLDEGG